MEFVGDKGNCFLAFREEGFLRVRVDFNLLLVDFCEAGLVLLLKVLVNILGELKELFLLGLGVVEGEKFVKFRGAFGELIEFLKECLGVWVLIEIS